MSSNFLKPSESGLRKPTDSGKTNGQIHNVPKYCEHGGFSSSSKAAGGNTFHITPPGRSK